MKRTSKLYKPVPAYSKFVDNQVLTNDQLNSLIDHFNYQDRLSRVLLTGVGIVCGLKVDFDSQNRIIHLSKGVAVTTQGNLIKMEDTSFIGFKEFRDREVNYPKFDPDKDGTPMPLFELETDLSPTDIFPLDKFYEKSGFELDRAVALLYIEEYPKEKEDCSPVDCDTQGLEMIEKLRVLLVSQNNAEALIKQDSIFSELKEKDSSEMIDRNRLFAQKIILNSENTQTYFEFRQVYKVSFELLKNKVSALGEISLFTEEAGAVGIDPIPDLESLIQMTNHPQYLYDFYKDLIDAYNELIALIKKDLTICCPNPNAFPKHILLGSLATWDSAYAFRHRFYPSPTHRKPGLETLQSAYRRILLMIKNYNARIGSAENAGEIRITPSQKDNAILGRRAIPFYYPLGQNKPSADFYKNWKEDDLNFLGNYYGYQYPEGLDPLKVCLDDCDFYRVEGHVGKDVRDSHKELKRLKQENGLAFDVLPIAVGALPDGSMVDFEKYRAYFDDLQVVLQAWNKEQECMASSASQFLSGFNLKEPGIHYSYDMINAMGNMETDIIYTGNFAMKKEEEASTVHSAMKTLSGGPSYEFMKNVKTAHSDLILTNVSQNEDSIGPVLAALYDSSSCQEANSSNILEAVGTYIAQVDPGLVQLVAKIPIDLVVDLMNTENNTLTNIEDFTEENLEKYIQTLKAQCKKAKAARKTLAGILTKDDNSISDKPWLAQYRNVLDQIASSCCVVEKLKTLYQEILQRKKKLMEELVLTNFIKNHPGAEHKAGVEKGGTFILVYFSKDKPNYDMEIFSRPRDSFVAQPVDRDQWVKNTPVLFKDEMTTFVKTAMEKGLIESRLSADNIVGKWYYQAKEYQDPKRLLKATMESGEVKMAVPAKQFNNGILNLIDYSRRGGIEANIWESNPEGIWTVNIPGYLALPPDGTVIGDLCLPYVCCSKTPSTTFVFPEQLASLRIPVDHVCMGGEDEVKKIPLTVMPAQGTIRTFVQNRELQGVIENNEQGNFFDPNQVAENDYGKLIRFEVNGQQVETTLEVNQKPQPDFTSFEKKVTFRNQNTVAEIPFQNTTQIVEGVTFHWDFNGQIVNNQNRTVAHAFKVQPGSTAQLSIKLIADNGTCRGDKQEEISIEVPRNPETQTCYNAEVLTCWGSKNISGILTNRQIDARRMNNSKMINALLKSLRETAGFTKNELTLLSRGPSGLKKLLSCMEIPVNDNTTPSQMIALIQEYQQTNCGQNTPDDGGVSPELINVLSPSGNPIAGAKVLLDSGDQKRTLITDLQGNIKIPEGFSDDLKMEISVPGFKTKNVSGKNNFSSPILLKESPTDKSIVFINPEILDKKTMKKITDKRGLNIRNNTDKKTILNALNPTDKGIAIKEEEVKNLKKSDIKNILDNFGKTYPSTYTKEGLIKLMFKK